MKGIILSIAVLLISSMSACSQNKQVKGNQMGKKTLVAYFSATGTTAAVAKTLARTANADLYEITPEQPYTSADLDWRNKKSRSTIEMADKSSRPAIKGTVANLNTYDIIFIGFPIWWNMAPTVINTFIEKNDLKGKVIIPFATSGGSDISNACNVLKNTYPQLNWGKGKLLNGLTEEEAQSFIQSNNRLYQ